jgi:hypothetical protein
MSRLDLKAVFMSYAAAWIYLVGFVIVAVVSAVLSPRELATFTAWASTSVYNLRHDPVGSLVVSAFVTHGYALAWPALIALALFGANKVLGNWRTALVCLAGQVIGTLVSEGIVGYRVSRGLLPAADRYLIDVGPSYVVVTAIVVALLYGSRPARAAAALDLGLLVVVGNIFGGLSQLAVSAVGHVTALAVGVVGSIFLVWQLRKRPALSESLADAGTGYPSPDSPDPDLPGPGFHDRSSVLTSPPACMATTAVSVMTAIGMRCPADCARTCASRRRRRLASPRRGLAHDHNDDKQQQERHGVEEQARHDVRDRQAVAVDEFAPGAPGPQRVTDTERLAQGHLAAPADLLAGSGKVAFGHHMAAAPVNHGAVTVGHRIEVVLVLRAGHISKRVDFLGQDVGGDARHRGEHEDDGNPAARVARRPAVGVGVQRVMRNAALGLHPDRGVGAAQACGIDDDHNQAGHNQAEQQQDRDNAQGCCGTGDAPERAGVDPRVHRQANRAACRDPRPPAPPVMQRDELGNIR